MSDKAWLQQLALTGARYSLRRGTIRTYRSCEQELKTRSIPERTDNSRLSWVSIVVLGFMALFVFAVVSEPYLAERQRRIQNSWPQVHGKGAEVRVVKQALNRRNFPFMMYEGECAVHYNVTGKQYSVWVSFGSTFADPDTKFVSDTKQSCLASSWVVRYKPQDPSEAVAERID
jgi:hypothetical protein